jgi:hypothetical protein
VLDVNTLHPFGEHLREAIAVNRQRREGWSDLSAGRTRSISRWLIGSEVALLPVAAWCDRRAAREGAAGTAALARCFVPMHGLGPVALAAAADAPSALLAARGATRQSLVRALARARGRDEPLAAREVLASALDQLAAARGTLAMRRHVLESARRVASVLLDTDVPKAIRQLLWQFALQHAQALRAADMLDDLALPLQREGIPILENDLPAIPS